MWLTLLFVVSAVVVAGADTPAPLSPDQQAAAITQQMAASLAAQRASVARQTAATAGRSFFLLPPGAAPRAVPSQTASCGVLPPEELAHLIDSSAKRSDLPPSLLHGVARQESSLRPCAVSPKGAMGLMQLMPDTARELGVKNPFDPAESIDGGARLLRKYLDMYGSLPLALGAYNAGPARVNDAGDVPQIPETLDYVRRILEWFPTPSPRK